MVFNPSTYLEFRLSSHKKTQRQRREIGLVHTDKWNITSKPIKAPRLDMDLNNIYSEQAKYFMETIIRS